MDHFFYRNLKRAYPTVSFARGVWVTDDKHRSYLDACSGAVVANIGHGVAEINEAIQEQLSKVAFTHSSQFVSEAALNLAERTIALAPGNFKNGRVYFVSGGSESVETALKMARGYFYELGQDSRRLVISRWNSYHGSTQGALAVTGHPARRKPYLPILSDHPKISPAHPYRCPCGFGPGPCVSEQCSLERADELEAAILKAGPENVMAFIGEPVVGAALGASVPSGGYWKRIREICSRYGVLLIADEVMTGLGRVGPNMGLDLWGVEPDIIALGKGLSAGYMPLGAVLASGEVVSAFEQGSGAFEHGFTYSAHPVSCAAGVAVLDYMQEHRLIQSVKQREKNFLAGLKEACSDDIVGDVRGHGFLVGVELVMDQKSKQPFPAELKLSQQVAAQALQNGLMIYPGSGSIDGVKGDHVIIAPPFTISESEMKELFQRLKLSIEQVSNKSLSALAG